MKKTLITLLLIINCVYAQNISFITKKYESYLSNTNQGVGLLIKHQGEVQFSTIGDIEITKNSVFNIGSATKKMTAILILQEMEKGKLSLSDSIGKFIGKLNNVDGSLTIESLLRHRSGLGEIIGRDFENQFFADNQFLSKAEILKNIPENNPELIAKHNYCNTNYFLLGCILENINDKSYFDLLRERIFEVCDMENTYPYVSKGLDLLVHPTHNGKDIYEHLNYKFFAMYAYAAGSVASSLADQEKFYGHLFEKNTLLKNESIEQLVSFDDAEYGLGMMTYEADSIQYYCHGGNNIGYSFREYYNPKTKDLILIFSNAYTIPFSTLLRNDAMNYINEKEAVIFEKNISKRYKKHLGTYFFKEMNMELNLFEKNNLLYLSVQGMDMVMIMIGNKLITKDYGIELSIDSKDTDQIIFRQNGMEANIVRVKSK